MAWVPVQCFVVSKALQENPSNPDLYRGAVVVRDYGLPNPTEVVTAYFGKSMGFLMSKQDAARLLSDIEVNTRWPCWVRQIDFRQVSMLAIPRAKAENEDIYMNMAWGSSFFAAISGFLLLALLANLVHKGLLIATGVRQAPGMNSDRQFDVPKRGICLTPMQAKFVCRAHGRVLNTKEESLEDWICSICLEDGEGEELVRVVTLPCKHQFHSR